MELLYRPSGGECQRKTDTAPGSKTEMKTVGGESKAPPHSLALLNPLTHLKAMRANDLLLLSLKPIELGFYHL